MIITGLIEYMVAVVGNMVKGIINVDYMAIMEALMEIYSKVIAKRNIISIRN
jgi:hypothetical protein